MYHYQYVEPSEKCKCSNCGHIDNYPDMLYDYASDEVFCKESCLKSWLIKNIDFVIESYICDNVT